MPVDSSIAMGAQLPQFQNPLDSAVKAMTLKDLSTRGQIQNLQSQSAQQEFNDNQAMRNAYANNTQVGEDGTPTLDQKGVLKELGTTSPSLVPKTAMQFASQRMEMQNQQIKNYSEKMGMAGQLAGAVTDQKSLDQLHVTAQAMGLPTDQIPTVYDPNETPSIMANLRDRALSAKEQAENSLKKQDMGIKEKELNLSLQKNQAEQVQQTLAALQSARGNPAVQQAERDVYSNSKVNKLVAQAKDKNGDIDPNLMNNTQVRLLAGEVGKIATGGAPTLDELQGLTPKNMPQWLSEAAEKYNNKPTGANAGAFVKQLQAYSNGVADDARDLMKTNYQGILETKKQWLPPGAYDTMNQQFIGRLNGDVAPGTEWSASRVSSDSGSKGKGSGKAPPVMSFDQWKASQGTASQNPKGGNGS